MISQLRFNLAQLNPITSNLHLLIHATETFDLSVAKMARQIPRPIQARPRFLSVE